MYGVTFVSLFGPYGLYEICLIFLAITMFAYPSESGWETTGLLSDAQTEKIVWIVTAAVDFGINSFFSIWFEP